MARTLSIKPIDIKYDTSNNLHTLQSSLATHGYVRGPGTFTILTPSKDASGKYKTGLDENAPYVQRLEGEAKKAELEMIKTLKGELKEVFGNIDISPKSEIWNAYSPNEPHVQPIKLGNDPVFVHTSNPIGLLNYCWARVDPRLAKSLESFHKKECPDCRYYIEDKEAEARLEYSKVQELNSSFRKFEDLTPTRRKDIATLLGLPVTDSTKDEVVYTMVYNFLKENSISEGEYKGRSSVQLLKEMLSMSAEHIEVKNLVNRAIRYNIYRDYEGRIEEGSLTVAPSKEDLVLKLVDPKNQQMRLALEAKIKAKKESLA